MEKQVITAANLLDKAAQLWKKLEEDPHIQQWDKEDEMINEKIQEFKKQHKTILILERVKGTQELKKLHA
jgi:hypothetical protein